MVNGGKADELKERCRVMRVARRLMSDLEFNRCKNLRELVAALKERVSIIEARIEEQDLEDELFQIIGIDDDQESTVGYRY